MVRPELRLARLHHLHVQLLGRVPPVLFPVRRRQIGHTGQRGRMVRPELRLARFHHLHLQLLGRVPPTPCIIYKCYYRQNVYYIIVIRF
jgi:hypothetical protein